MSGPTCASNHSFCSEETPRRQTPQEGAARKIARTFPRASLKACLNGFDCESRRWWDGDDAEAPQAESTSTEAARSLFMDLSLTQAPAG